MIVDVKTNVIKEIEMVKGKNKRLFAGYYKKYDDSLIYVVTLVTDVDTGAESVIFHEGMYAENVTFKSMSRESFCEMVEVDGELVDKFIRQTNMKITEAHDTNIIEAGFNPPMRKPKKEDGDIEALYERDYRCSTDYVSYAKDLIENYRVDIKRYKLCKQYGKIIGVYSKRDFGYLIEDITFLRDCFKTVLVEYHQFMKERYLEGKSIRKYADEHGINRGSVVYLNQKMINAFAAELRKRDESDGIRRLRK